MCASMTFRDTETRSASSTPQLTLDVLLPWLPTSLLWPPSMTHVAPSSLLPLLRHRAAVLPPDPSLLLLSSCPRATCFCLPHTMNWKHSKYQVHSVPSTPLLGFPGLQEHSMAFQDLGELQIPQSLRPWDDSSLFPLALLSLSLSLSYFTPTPPSYTTICPLFFPHSLSPLPLSFLCFCLPCFPLPLLLVQHTSLIIVFFY